MKVKFTIKLFGFFLSTLLAGVSFAAENAFGSLISDDVNNSSSSMGMDPAQTIDRTLHPLIQSPVNTNTLMAIMISPSLKIAFIKTLNGEEYFIRIGDALGNANGVITNITSNTIEVTEESVVVSLSVRNRSVSNETSK